MILCAGEALIDMLPRETTDGQDAFAPHAGGAVFNTAIALGRLRVPTGFFSGLSTDLFGVLLEESLAASNVDARFAARSDLPTTLAFVRLVDGHATYAFYDENTAGRMLSDDDLPSTTGIDALFFGGISLVVEPCAAIYEALMLREAAQRVTMIDPNIRPGFVKDEEGYRARITRMMAAADIVKVSDEDLTWLQGPGEIETRARDLLTTGPSLVLVTRGSLGATAYHKAGEIFVPSERTTVVDTVGAGDTFNAGFLASLHEQGVLNKPALAALGDQSLEAALKLGAQCAAITVSRAGANPPTRAEL